MVKVYQALIVLFTLLFPLLVRTMPSLATTSERLGRAMLRVVQGRADRFILDEEVAAPATATDERRRYYRLTRAGREALKAEVDRLGALLEVARAHRIQPRRS
jgi:hypothetical protein